MESRNKKGFPGVLESYWKTYSNSTAEYFLWLTAKHALKNRAYARMESHLAALLERWPQGGNADAARFWLYKINKKNGHNEKKKRFFRELLLHHPDSSYTWALMPDETAGKTVEELTGLFEKSDSNTDACYYHSLLSYVQKDMAKRDARLSHMKNETNLNAAKLQRDIKKLKLSSSVDDELRALDRYFTVGSMDLVNREMRFLPDDDRAQVDKYIALAHYSRKYSHYFLGVHALQELFRLKEIRENPFVIPGPIMKQLYPRGFRDCVERCSSDYNIEADMIYAVIKAESSFNHEAVSPVGAVGLMQLMRPTAGDVAKQLNVKSYNLKDPCTSIRFGTRYLSWLMKYFNNNMTYVVAGYNAGAGNVLKWRKEVPADDADYFAEMIPFGETRGYILRTAKFSQIYSILYSR